MSEVESSKSTLYPCEGHREQNSNGDCLPACPGTLRMRGRQGVLKGNVLLCQLPAIPITPNVTVTEQLTDIWTE